MKNSIVALKLCLVCLLMLGAAHSAHAIVVQCSPARYVFAPPGGPISRTYPNTSHLRNSNWRQKKVGNHPPQKTLTDVVISYQDFQSHLAVGQDRIVRIVDPSSGVLFMDVGVEGLATGEVWNMPDLSPTAFPAGQTVTYSSVVVTSAPNYESFTSEDPETGVVTNPAAAYQLGSGF